MSTAGTEDMREVLRGLDLFQELDDPCLDRLVAAGQEWTLGVGEDLVHEGDEVTDFRVILDGAIEWSREIGGHRVVVGHRRGRTYAGAMNLLTEEPSLATGTAVEPTRIFRIPGEEFRRLLREEDSVLRAALRVIAPVQQAAGRAIEQREKLVALGTLSAGLAHELNNPAAAARRSAEELARALAVMQETLHAFVSSGVERREAARLVELQREAVAAAAEAVHADVGALEMAEREDELADLLDELGQEGWRLAPPLAEAGVGADWLQQVAAAAGPATGAALEWVAASLGAATLAAELGEATERISTIVSAMRDYTQLDRASVREIDLNEGIVSTLVILGHRIRDSGTRVVKRLDPDLPAVTASGAQLNQVWTNLITNALDALGGGGTITITTRPRGEDHVEVVVADDGPGIPDEVRGRIFEPFFTTKDVGEGTGLGLDVSARVVRAHRGDISVESAPGDTRFSVRLPVAGPGAGAGP